MIALIVLIAPFYTIHSHLERLASEQGAHVISIYLSERLSTPTATLGGVHHLFREQSVGLALLGFEFA